ncbi:helix-turn-helix domain-containing protein [Arthrobacter castelli]|uniref:helix-turn-helix domain-containing protein n=1 Tax=Arthrobacter castelli TaxID=271431 RepID=UPI0004143B8B|nr:helix-turn-helix transcriptional regulator [Arthrobacter castelli]
MTDSKVVPLRASRQWPEPVLLRHAVGSVLRRERKRQRRTLDDVAVRAGVSVQYLSEIERGRKEPSSEVIAAVCGALGGQLVDLVGAVQLELSSGGTRSVGAPMSSVPEPGAPMSGVPESGQPQLLAV